MDVVVWVGTIGSVVAATAALIAVLRMNRERQRTMRAQVLLDVLDLLAEGETADESANLVRWRKVHARIRILRIDPSTYLWKRFRFFPTAHSLASSMGIEYDDSINSIEEMLLADRSTILRNKMFDELRAIIRQDIGIKLEKGQGD